MATASSSSRSVTTFFQPAVAQSTIEAETRWSLFVAKHNLAFLNSDHASKLFAKMFKDSQIAKKFSCARTKCAAITTEALAPYYTNKLKTKSEKSIFNNDKTDKSCII